MFIFGHLGITLGIAVIGNEVLGRLWPGCRTNFKRKSPEKRPDSSSYQQVTAPSAVFQKLYRFLDIRLLLLGALLPDIIDKPVGHVFFKDIFSNGRIFSHTLVFVLLFLITAITYYVKRRQTWLLALAIGITTHCILDAMWKHPSTLFWPLYGWSFPRLPETGILDSWIITLINNPGVYIPEIIGAFILASFFFWLLSRRNVLLFLSGKPFDKIKQQK
jgi:inner membrane protein